MVKTIDGAKCEPIEELTVDVPDENSGKVIEMITKNKGELKSMTPLGSRIKIEFEVPSRGLIGFRSQFLTDTKGSGIMNTLFDSYVPWSGDIPQRNTGALIADRPGKVTSYACLGMVDRGELFIEVGTDVYKGMINLFY